MGEDSYIKMFLQETFTEHRCVSLKTVLWTNIGNSWFGRPLVPIYKDCFPN